MSTIEIIIGITGIVASITIGVVSLVKSTRNAEKLASKEYELSENARSDMLKFMAILSSISTKIRRLGTDSYAFQDELRELRESSLTSGYLVLKSLIKDKGKQRVFNDYAKMLTSKEKGADEILEITELLQSILCDIDFKNVKINLQELMEELCVQHKEDRGIYEIPQFSEFVKYMYEKGVRDADIALFHGVFENNVDIVKKSLDEGADTQCTDKMIVEKYKKEYEKYLSLKNTTR